MSAGLGRQGTPLGLPSREELHTFNYLSRHIPLPSVVLISKVPTPSPLAPPESSSPPITRGEPTSFPDTSTTTELDGSEHNPVPDIQGLVPSDCLISKIEQFSSLRILRETAIAIAPGTALESLNTIARFTASKHIENFTHKSFLL